MASSEPEMKTQIQWVSSISTQCVTKNADSSSPHHARAMSSLILEDFVSRNKDETDALGFCWVDDDSSNENNHKIDFIDEDSDNSSNINGSQYGTTCKSIARITEYITDGENSEADLNNHDNDDNQDRNDDGEDTKSIDTEESEFIGSLSEVAHKFDALFPFYRLSDKDCKEISLFVYENLNKINKVFCISKGRVLEAIVYYHKSISNNNNNNNTNYIENRKRLSVSGLPFEKFIFFNGDDTDEEVSSWNDINMDEKYCFRELGLLSISV